MVFKTLLIQSIQSLTAITLQITKPPYVRLSLAMTSIGWFLNIQILNREKPDEQSEISY